MFYFVDKPLDLGYLSVESIHIISRSETVNAIITIATTLLWFVYVWASVALGYKGSNLTNRGIVSSGPYRYFRHPAYVSKVSVWVLSAVYFGKMNIALVLTLLIIYGLRAWTEERHLSADPEYLDYKKKVPWMFFPRVF